MFAVDNRLLFILLPIKQWAYNEGLLDPQEGKLSGYLITLMTIFYLQAGHITPGAHFFSLSESLDLIILIVREIGTLKYGHIQFARFVLLRLNAIFVQSNILENHFN